MALPSNTNEPDVADTTRQDPRDRRLAEPDSPTSATISPDATSKETSSMACSCPRVRKPPTRNSRVRSWTLKMASGIVLPRSSDQVATHLVVPVAISSGRTLRHSSFAYAQRGAKRHPSGGPRATADCRRCVSCLDSPSSDGNASMSPGSTGAPVGRRPRASDRARRSHRRTSPRVDRSSATRRSCRA